MDKKKILWVDNIRGLAIIAVVIGHVATPLTKYIYPWHIPLFFYISGYLINKKKPIKDSLKKDFLKLIVPFFVFSLIGLSAEYLKRWLFPGFTFINGSVDFRSEITGIFWWMNYSHLRQYGFVLWFLPALFWSKSIYRILIIILKNNYVISIVCFGILFFVSARSPVLPFGLSGGLNGLFWLTLSWLLTGRIWIITMLALLFLPVPGTNLALNLINPYGVLYSLIVINTIVGLVKFVPKNFKLLVKFGRETMPILIIHPYINNIAYLLIIYLLKDSWILEIIVILVSLTLIVYNLNPTRMVLSYIIKNNKLWFVPSIVIKSFLSMVFQVISKRELVKNLGNGRKIILFPGSVLSRMFLYTDIPDNKEIDLLRSKIDSRSIFLDIGANIGSYSVLLSDKTKRIYAFEPSPTVNEFCKKNYLLNKINPKNVNKIALSDKRGKSGFTDFGGVSTINQLTDDNRSGIMVQTDSLDNWVKENIKIKDFNLILKIDVEGAEDKVLKGARYLFKSKFLMVNAPYQLMAIHLDIPSRDIIFLNDNEAHIVNNAEIYSTVINIRPDYVLMPTDSSIIPDKFLLKSSYNMSLYKSGLSE